VINPTLVVVFDVENVGRRVIRETIGEVADILYLTDVPAAERAAVLRRADVIFAQHTAKDLGCVPPFTQPVTQRVEGLSLKNPPHPEKGT
jgi:hypothetical protein